MDKELRIIISGGGTGGHIFPAISIANAIKMKHPDAKILFVGAKGRMEMQRVPAAGYEIKGLPICGFDRKHLLKNIIVLFKIFRSQQLAKYIIHKFKPMVAIGVGGYASGPTLNEAGIMGIPTLIQEQNSYAGVTNKLLAKKACKICVAYEGMERFFDKNKIIITGNPVRQNLLNSTICREDGIAHFKLDSTKKTILVIGGSLGARTINECIIQNIEKIKMQSDIQIIWQTGKYYFAKAKESIKDEKDEKDEKDLPLYCTDFISSMEHAYAAADLVISRAGAGSISEFCLLGKSVILVPSPNVAEDHQTKNALALVKKEAAIYVKDDEAIEKLIPVALEIIRDKNRLSKLSKNIKQLAYPNSASIIAQEVYKLAKKYKEENGI